MQLANLKNVNPNYLGMIDQVVCTGARCVQYDTSFMTGEMLSCISNHFIHKICSHFIGTWFSTFTGYITRMRGYKGYSDKTVWFGDIGHRYFSVTSIGCAVHH